MNISQQNPRTVQLDFTADWQSKEQLVEGVALCKNSRQFEIRKIKIELPEEAASRCDPEMSELSSSSSAPSGQEQGTGRKAVVTLRQEGRNSQSYSGKDKSNCLPDSNNIFADLSFPLKLWLRAINLRRSGGRMVKTALWLIRKSLRQKCWE